MAKSKSTERKTPYYKMYAEDFMTGVADMGFVQRGAYISLLNYQWIKGILPKSKDTLYRMVGAMTDSEKEAVDFLLTDKFVETPEGWVNQRLRVVHEEAVAFMAKQVENGSKGGRPPKNPDDNPKDNPEVSQEESQTESQEEACHSSYSYSQSNSSNTDDTSIPKLKKWWDEFFFTKEIEFQRAWHEWLTNVRNKKKCSNSDRAVRKQLNRVVEFCEGNVQTAIDVVLQSCDKGWTEVYELQQKRAKTESKFLWEQQK